MQEVNNAEIVVTDLARGNIPICGVKLHAFVHIFLCWFYQFAVALSVQFPSFSGLWWAIFTLFARWTNHYKELWSNVFVFVLL